MDLNITDLDIKLKNLNLRRLKLFIVNAVIIILFVTLYLMVAFYLRDNFNVPSRTIRYGCLPVIYALYYLLKSKKGNFNKIYDEFILKDVLRNLYPQWAYHNEAEIDAETVYQTFLIRRGSNIDVTNNISGYISNTYFDFSEIKVLKNQFLGAKLPKKLFHGYFFIFNNNKNIESRLFVRPSLIRDFGSMDFKEGKIQTDTGEFDKRFTTYSEDPVTARYILTPALMSRMLDFDAKYKNLISFLFFKDKLYIAFKGNKNFLEPALRKKITVETIRIQMGIFKLIGAVVEELNIDKHIWMTEKKNQEEQENV